MSKMKRNYCGFWKRVVEELEYQNKERKWLATEANFDVSTIGTGLKRDGMPHADLALKIARTLNVPIEFLVFGTSFEIGNKDSGYNYEILDGTYAENFNKVKDYINNLYK